VISDTSELRNQLYGRLSDRGYAVSAQDATRAALELAAGEPFDLIVLEVPSEATSAERPQEEAFQDEAPARAFELTERVRRSFPHAPIVLLTRQACLAVALAVVRAGAFDFLTLPLDLTLLFGTLERALSRRSAVVPALGRRPAANAVPPLGAQATLAELSRESQLAESGTLRAPSEHPQARTPGADLSTLVSLEEVERRYILKVLEATGGNKTQAAQILGMDRRTLHRKCDRYWK
jgi:DNA-binding NtrC family response regulator